MQSTMVTRCRLQPIDTEVAGHTIDVDRNLIVSVDHHDCNVDTDAIQNGP